MKKILAATTHSEIEQAVKEACTKYAAYFDFTVCSETDEIIKCIDFELPEIKVIDFTSDARMDCKKLLDTISSDPWLHNGGIIAIASDMNHVKEIEEQKNSNILIVQTKEQFMANFTRLLRILWQNQQFLFSRGMQGQLGASEKGSFVCANDPMDIQVYTGFLVNYLYGSNRIDTETRYKLQTVLTEMLFNALEHGNCGISFQDKTEWLEQGKNIVTLIRQKARLGENEKKRIYISYTLDTQHAEFVIRDDGEGFDWRSRVNRTVAPDTHGMGIGLSESLINKLTYNDKGNEVRFSIDTVQNTANTVPLIISPYETLNYTDKQIVCMQNERTNDLFFIVSGRYGVYADRKLVSVLTPNDMFIGEMSFLLNDKRSATVMSAGNGQLIKIPKGAFLNLIRKNPHYGIFLSKLLAQRLYIQTQKTMALDKKLKEQSE
ncbi:MAG: cyclic nucleotide-binding domain-containing protein [Treponema lecithinolyticum]|uniref:cyclic nucleotide-binding domain-containing protein n=1 Tax=Treponema lecithinolyticum TaxID=53418 RepID=UPI00361073E9